MVYDTETDPNNLINNEDFQELTMAVYHLAATLTESRRPETQEIATWVHRRLYKLISKMNSPNLVDAEGE